MWHPFTFTVKPSRTSRGQGREVLPCPRRKKKYFESSINDYILYVHVTAIPLGFVAKYSLHYIFTDLKIFTYLGKCYKKLKAKEI
jgi:hypothetical protein